MTNIDDTTNRDVTSQTKTVTTTDSSRLPPHVTSTKKTTTTDIQSESWYTAYWRPSMAWAYLTICLFDFIIFPMLMGIYAGILKVPYVPWVPLTLQGGGLVHVAFGAIVGTYTWGRTREKLQNENGGGGYNHTSNDDEERRSSYQRSS
jgi:hypothetical protein